MKKLFTIIAAASMFAACNTKSDLDTQKDVIVTDTSSMYKSNGSTDVGNTQTPNPAPAIIAAPPTVAPVTQTRTIIRERTVYVERPRATRQVVRQADPVSPVVNTVPQSQTQTQSQPTPTASTGTGNNQSTGVGSIPGNNEGTGTASTYPSTVEKKKGGWSNAAKDATIGGVGGAVGGAILSRNKGKGAVLGGIIGAAGGYILGRKKDKKDAGINYADN
jgi:hypothetical protein